MSGNIKGITIELAGDTKGLDSALKSVTSQSATLGKDLKTVNQLLKLDPGNVELTAQKQQILAQSVETTAEKLEILRNAQAQVKAQFEAGEISREQYIAFQEELVRTESRMDSLKSAQSAFRAEMDGSASSAKSLTQTVSEQEKELSELKSKYVDVAAAQGADSDEAQELASQIQQLSGELKDNKGKLAEAEKAADELDQTIDDLGDSEQDTEKKTSKLGETLKSGLTVAATAAAAAVAAATAAVVGCVAGVVKATAETAEYGDNIDKMSQKLGMSAEAYQEWDFIMQHNGSSIDSMTTSMKKLSEAVVDQSDKSVKAFDKLGISMDDAAKMSQEELFSATITALQGMESSSERTALATDLLGKSAMELGPLLNMSAEETEAMRQQVHDLGGVMSDESVKASAAYQDSLQNMQTAFGGVTRNLTSQFMPAITNVMDGVTALVSGDSSGIGLITEGLRGFTEQFNVLIPQITSTAEQLLPVIVDAITSNLPLLLGSAATIITALAQGLLDNLPTIISIAGDIILQLADALLGMLPQIVSTGLQIIAQLAVGIAQALPTLIPTVVDVVLQIVDTLIDNIDVLIDAAIAIIMALSDGLIASLPILIEKTPEIVQKLVTALVNNAPKLLKSAVELIGKLASGLVSNLPKIVSAGWDIVKSLASGILQMDGKIISAAKDIISSITTKFKELPAKALQWGKDMIQNFINGIKNLASSVGDAVSGVASSIKSILGFSEPEKGPLSNFHTFAPDMLELFAEGITNNRTVITDTMTRLAQDIADAASGISVFPDDNLDFTLRQYEAGRLKLPDSPQKMPAPAGSNGQVSGGNNTFNITINVQQMNSDYDVRRAAEVMAQEIERLTTDNSSLKGAWAV